MKILVTGGTGFVGSQLVSDLSSRGDEVTVVTRNPAGKTPTHPTQSVKYVAWSEVTNQSGVEGFDAIVHLSGEPIFGKRWSAAQKAKIRSSRIDSTAELVQAMSKTTNKPKAFVCASAIGIYGDRKDEVLTESSPDGSGFLAEVCQAWEQEAAKAEALGVRTSSVRIGVVLGKGGGALSQMLTPFKLGLGGRIGSGAQYFSWIHVSDLSRLIQFCLDPKQSPDASISGPMNGTAPDPVTNKQFTKTLGKVLKRPTLFPVPPPALKLLLGEGAGILLESQRVQPSKALEHGFQFEYPELQAALTQILK